ncbi:Pre-mRNA-processing factor 39 [Candida tropicalis]
MSVLHLPQDLEDTLRVTSSPSSAIPSSILSLINDISQDLNNIDKWNQLFKQFQYQINQYEDPTKTPKELKEIIHQNYEKLLSRYPYLETIWEDWSNLELSINGNESYQNILRMSIENYPNSIKLWTNYLKTMIETNKDNVELIRGLYKQALIQNEYDFNSHELWNLIIEFETKLKDDSIELCELYIRVLKVPLYHYSQYYNQFTELNKKFNIELIIPKDELINYYKEFGYVDNYDKVSMIEKYQIVDNYLSNIFNKTQEKVNSNWQFESLFEYTKFDLKTQQEIKNEKESWIKYIDQEINIYKQSDHSKEEFNLICNLFERSLVPNCFDCELWLKYINFIKESNQDDDDDDEKMNKIKDIYIRINSKLIPLDETITRFNYVYFLKELKEFNQSNEYLINWIKLYSGGNSKTYYKLPYLKTFKELIKLWEELISRKKLISNYEFVINQYFNTHDKLPKKEEDQSSTSTSNDDNNNENDDKLELSKSLITSIINFINDESICLIVVSYLNQLLKQNDISTIRSFFNKFHSFNCFKKSTQFWRFYFNLESSSSIGGNLSNLKLIMNYIKYSTQLPKSIIDAFIELNYKICGDNIKEYLQLNNGISDDTLIRKDLDTCNSIFYNKTTIKRQARNNYIIANINHNGNNITPTSSSSSSSINITTGSKPKKRVTTNEDEFLSLSSKHIGHPGIFVDAIPQITNKIMGTDIDLTNSNLTIPPLPLFRNVEKASLPIKYPPKN